MSEPVLIWTTSGEVELEGRENKGPWIKSLIKKRSFFLISGGAPYYCRWRTISREPFEYMLVLVELPLLQRALEEAFGADVHQVRLRDLSGFEDAVLNSLMEQLYDELMRRKASPLRVQGLAQIIAIHLAQNYSETVKEHGAGPSLPGYKLRHRLDGRTRHRRFQPGSSGRPSRFEQVSLSSFVQGGHRRLTFALSHQFAHECGATTAPRNKEKRCECRS